MITCKYCGISYETFSSICPSCSAPTQIIDKKPEKTAAQITADKVRKVCDHYMNKIFDDNRDFKDGESVSDKRMDTIRKAFRVFPIGKEIFLYCDTTPFRTGKHGFMICEDGIYWQNTWATSTNRNFLSWDKFEEREIILKKFDLEFGKGDAIGLAGLGTDAVRKVVAEFFQSIQKNLKE